MVSIDAWWFQGDRLPLHDATGPSFELFVHAGGEGPCVTFLHGFPSSSWDWAPLLEETRGIRHLAPDLLGFGDSEKPSENVYSFDLQIELLTDLWERSGVDRTWIVAHDYSVSIAQEILARIQEGTWQGPDVEAVSLLNGGLFYSAIDRKIIQDVLRTPLLGDLVARAMPRFRFEASFGDVFAEEHRPTREVLDQHWRAVTRRGGRRSLPKVARYLDERREREERWTQALADAPVPTRYVWGLKDPISGPTILQALRERVPDADVHVLDDVGHYPQIEAPKRSREALLLP